MGEITSPLPVKLVIGIITGQPQQLPAVYRQLREPFGEIDFTSQLLPFDWTPYYEPEMGKNLQRQFVSFERLIDPDQLAPIKHLSNAIEAEFLREMTKDRQVNLDPGYVSASKLILASTKDHAHRIYLRQGIHAEMTLRFHRKTFQPWEWTYPDYRSVAYIEIFNQIRQIYMEQTRTIRT